MWVILDLLSGLAAWVLFYCCTPLTHALTDWLAGWLAGLHQTCGERRTASCQEPIEAQRTLSPDRHITLRLARFTERKTSTLPHYFLSSCNFLFLLGLLALMTSSDGKKESQAVVHRPVPSRSMWRQAEPPGRR